MMKHIPRKKLAIKIAAVAGGLIMGLVLFEAFFQLADLLKGSKPDVASVLQQRPVIHPYQPSPWYHSFPSANVAMHTVLAPFSEDSAHYGQHNSQGFRSREYTTAHPPDTFRIVAVGDSFTYGWGVKENETYTAALEKILTGKSGKGIKAEVINLGIAGSRPADNFVRLLAHGEALAPDLLIFQLQLNDLEYSLLLPYIDFFGGWFYEAGQAKGLFSRLEFAVKTLKVLKKRDIRDFTCMLRDSEMARMTEPHSFESRLYGEVLKSLDEWRKRTGVPVLVVAFPMLDSDRNGLNFNNYTNMEGQAGLNRKLYRTLTEGAIAVGFPLCDMMEIYRKTARGRYLSVSESDSHPNPLGHELAARAIYEAITTKIFPDRLPVPRPKGQGWEEEAPLRGLASKSWKDHSENLEKQLDLFSALASIHPKDPWTRFHLAFVHENLGHDAESRRLYESLEALAPGLAMPWYHAGHRLSGSGREIYMKKVLKTLPDYSFALKELAEIYSRTGRQKDACAAYTRLARHPLFPDNFKNAVLRLKGMGCFDENTVRMEHFQGLGDLEGPDGKMRFDTLP